MSQPRPMRPSPLRREAVAALGLVLAILTALGCSITQPIGPTSGTARPDTAAPASPSPTIEETPTALPPKVILVAPESEAMAKQLEAVLPQLAADAGLEFERMEGMPSDFSGARIEIAVVLTPIDELRAQAESFPETQFITVGLKGLSPTANLTVIGSLTDRTDAVAFLAGYMAALVSDDWRVASISQAGETLGASSRLAFANGATFFCGLCRPGPPPYPGYPLDYSLPLPTDPQAVQAMLTQIKQDGVEIVFIQQGLDEAEVVDGLSQQGVRIIGVAESNPGESQGWIASIEGDASAAVTSVWPSLLDGQSGGELKLPLRVDVYDAGKLTPGRFGLLQTIVDDIEAGLIDPGIEAGKAGGG